MALHLRPAAEADLPHVQRTLWLAMTWNGAPEGATFERAMAIPELAMYHEDWMRGGDVGVVAEDDGTVVGCAYGRLFTDDKHGHGFVDEATPEIAIAVEPEHTGNGIGGQLLAELADAYRATDVVRLSLSVHHDNAALRLYERHGYEELDRDTDSVRMIKQL